MSNEKNMLKEIRDAVVFIIVLVVSFVFFVLELVDLKNIKDSELELNRDKVLYIQSNDVGCNRYSYNDEHFWYCGDNNDSIKIVEHEECKTSSATKMRRCSVVYESVISSNKFKELNSVK